MAEDLTLVQSQISAAECHGNDFDAAIFGSRNFCVKVFKFTSPSGYVNLRSCPSNKAAHVIQQSRPATYAVQDFGPGVNFGGGNDGRRSRALSGFNTLCVVQRQPIKESIGGGSRKPLRTFTQHNCSTTSFQLSDGFVNFRLRHAGDLRKPIRCLPVVAKKPNINTGFVLRETQIGKGRDQIRARFHLLTVSSRSSYSLVLQDPNTEFRSTATSA
ncbi:unannotated protein [freshwater metagenome]|uniref:Unannotated protein n=1 Tax=freshwater metagenome TaxID=449393 RepID=A0A6J7RFV8_9ZZZZ